MKFNMNSPVFQFLENLVDFTALNLLFLLTCLPIITIGPALSALYTITLREAREEHGTFVKPYLKAFKSNFTSSAVLFGIYFASAAVLLFSIGFWMNMATVFGNFMLLVLILCSMICGASFFYVFALNARFENSIRHTIKNALLFTLANPKCSAGLLAIAAVSCTLAYLVPVLRVFMVLFGFAFIAYCDSFLLTKIFRQFETGQSGQ